jgi:hypothetical protein
VKTRPAPTSGDYTVPTAGPVPAAVDGPGSGNFRSSADSVSAVTSRDLLAAYLELFVIWFA